MRQSRKELRSLRLNLDSEGPNTYQKVPLCHSHRYFRATTRSREKRADYRKPEASLLAVRQTQKEPNITKKRGIVALANTPFTGNLQE
jgi:hypothetical protein